jgi:hypothetical protein
MSGETIVAYGYSIKPVSRVLPMFCPECVHTLDQMNDDIVGLNAEAVRRRAHDPQHTG